MDNHTQHRSNKHTNKPHKTGRHRSKGAIDNALRGKTSVKVISRTHKNLQKKSQRRNQLIQIRKNKLEEVFTFKNQIGNNDSAPFLICILPMHLKIDPMSSLSIFKKCHKDAVVKELPSKVTHINVPRLKQRFTFVIPPIGPGNEITVLDYLKVCDTTLFLTSALTDGSDFFDEWGQTIYNMISAQGIPSPTVGLMDLESISSTERSFIRTSVQKYISTVLPHVKVMKLDTDTEGLSILRRIGNQKRSTLHNRDNRAHLLCEKFDFISKSEYSENSGMLKVMGFLRGIPLDVNGLVHIPSLGDYQISHVDVLEDIYKSDNLNNIEEKVQKTYSSNAEKQTILQSENVCVPMDFESSYHSDVANELAGNIENKRMMKRVPKGWSEYQAAWIPSMEMEVLPKNNIKKSEDNNIAMIDEDDFSLCNDDSLRANQDTEDDTFETKDNVDIGLNSDVMLNDEQYDLQMNFQEEHETLKKIKDARCDELWPDEIDTPNDTPARTRFRKFRGLESFKTSPWDPKENLPNDYSRIYQFQNFERSKKRILVESKNIKGVTPGSYVAIYISNVVISKWLQFKNSLQADNIIVYGMLPHEHQISVVNVVLKRTPNSEIPIKSKEKLIVQCGYRRFVVNPIFSQHTNGDKFKYERYFRPNSVVCATFYAPIQFPPAPVLTFKEDTNSALQLVASGFLLSCNPDRIILKRIVLSGHPARIHRKTATIRYMFFNKEDVDYFKTIKLRTKCGRVGHIKESLGTHGHMKCCFDGHLLSYDTVFMYLYKRVFPKWTYSDYSN